MNWQARPQRSGSLDREMPQSVHRWRGSAGANVGALKAGNWRNPLKSRSHASGKEYRNIPRL
jgi:hypothetical protein